MNDVPEHWKKYHPFFIEAKPPIWDCTVAKECGDKITYQGKIFILQQVIFAKTEGDRFGCPHCWTENEVPHGRLVECTECGKGMAVLGGALYYEE